MNYPVWNLEFFGGGLLIALIAVFHVYISHFAVGGGLFLVLAEMKGNRENNPAIIDYVRKHAKFFLLVTMVAGSMTGVGIWFTIALLNPAATSILIHNYVFGWATEWVFFLIEIISLFIYAYTFGRLDRKTHLLMGWIYFGAAWMSLFIINGIIDFMLTPGAWLENHNFWSGFFNPTFWPALFFRTFLALIIAGLFGLLTSTRIKDDALRHSMVRHCALYLVIPFVLLLGSAWWYREALPPELRVLIFQTMPEMKPFVTGFLYFSVLLFAGGLLMAIRTPKSLGFALALVLLIIGQLYMGCFEFLREGGRRPYIIRDYMYSNSILKEDLDKVRKTGVLKNAKWVENKEIRENNLIASGKELYNLLCLPCHSIGGPLNDILPVTANFTPWGLANMIQTIDRFHPYMPPFPGKPDEAKALAAYIATGLHGKKDPGSTAIIRQPAEKIALAKNNPQYVLLAWTDMGMQSMTDSSATWMMLPPGVTLHALLIKRDEFPELITEQVTITYKVDAPFADPDSQIDFWENVEKLYGRELAANTGLTGNGLAGSLEPGENDFTATMIPVAPYTDAGDYMPYPSATVMATAADGTLLATTRVTLPTATEMGCKNCHGGQWRVQGKAGLASATAENVLAVHDRLSGTNLAKQAAAGKPVLCQQCHQDARVGLAGDGKRLNMSASMHGLHANFITGAGEAACTACHPASDTGATRAFRGIHHALELGCTDCHGTLADHAISLLKAEEMAGKKRAATLLEHLQPQVVSSKKEVQPRKPWVNEPDCLNCHEEFEAPSDTTTFNKWTADRDELFSQRTDEAGFLPCSACHNSMHALYPTLNPYGENLDNRQPAQYQHNSLPMGSNMGCAVCHTVKMEEEMHHPNMLREFRNQ